MQNNTRQKTNSPKVDPAGIDPIARCPYPNSGGIVNVLLSPMHMSSNPSSHLDPKPSPHQHTPPRFPNKKANQKTNSPLDNHALADREAQGLTTLVARIEHTAVARQRAAVMHLDAVASLRFAAAGVGEGVFGCDSRRCCEGCEGYEGQEEGLETHDCVDIVRVWGMGKDGLIDGLFGGGLGGEEICQGPGNLIPVPMGWGPGANLLWGTCFLTSFLVRHRG